MPRRHKAAAAKMQMLMERLEGSGQSFRDLAMGYSEDPESAPRAATSVSVPVSRLKQAPPQLRDARAQQSPGHRERGERRRRAYHLVLVAAPPNRRGSATCRRPA